MNDAYIHHDLIQVFLAGLNLNEKTAILAERERDVEGEWWYLIEITDPLLAEVQWIAWGDDLRDGNNDFPSDYDGIGGKILLLEIGETPVYNWRTIFETKEGFLRYISGRR